MLINYPNHKLNIIKMNNKNLSIISAGAIFLSVCGVICLVFIAMHDVAMHSKLNKNKAAIDSLQHEIKLRDGEILLYRSLIKDK